MTATGGLADLFLLYGDSEGSGAINPTTLRPIRGPNKVIMEYQNLVGKPADVPRWALGWHIGHESYNDTLGLVEYINGYETANFPFESIWTSQETMKDSMVFTVDNEDDQNFKGIQDVVQGLHDKNKKFVPYFTSGVAKKDYDAYNKGKEYDIYVDANPDNTEPLIGLTEAGHVVYPDFHHPLTKIWWIGQLDTLNKTLPFDGIMLGKNAPYNLCNGTCINDQQYSDPLSHKLIYTPGNANLELERLPLDAYHDDKINVLDTYNMYPTFQANATSFWYSAKHQKSFIISEYGSAGIGKAAVMQEQESDLTSKSMASSVQSTMMESMMGIALSGSSICGAQGHEGTEEE